MRLRDTSHDIDDPDVSLTDPIFQRASILAKHGERYHHTNGQRQPDIQIQSGTLVFNAGVFDMRTLRHLIKPTMKGFWVPIKVRHGAEFQLGGELIGMQNCDEHYGGTLKLMSDKMQSFELVPLLFVSKLDISESPKLFDLTKLPLILSGLTVAAPQLKGNLAALVANCGAIDFEVLHQPTLTKIFKHAFGLKRSMTNRKVLLQLQQDLIDNDFEEYSHL